MVVPDTQVVCPHCNRRITVDRGVFRYTPAGPTPTYRVAPAALA